jgi:hypothetical protein
MLQGFAYTLKKFNVNVLSIENAITIGAVTVNGFGKPGHSPFLPFQLLPNQSAKVKIVFRFLCHIVKSSFGLQTLMA